VCRQAGQVRARSPGCSSVAVPQTPQWRWLRSHSMICAARAGQRAQRRHHTQHGGAQRHGFQAGQRRRQGQRTAVDSAQGAQAMA